MVITWRRETELLYNKIMSLFNNSSRGDSYLYWKPFPCCYMNLKHSFHILAWPSKTHEWTIKPTKYSVKTTDIESKGPSEPWPMTCSSFKEAVNSISTPNCLFKAGKIFTKLQREIFITCLLRVKMRQVILFIGALNDFWRLQHLNICVRIWSSKRTTIHSLCCKYILWKITTKLCDIIKVVFSISFRKHQKGNAPTKASFKTVIIVVGPQNIFHSHRYLKIF